jgi:hypothetical protein
MEKKEYSLMSIEQIDKRTRAATTSKKRLTETSYDHESKTERSVSPGAIVPNFTSTLICSHNLSMCLRNTNTSNYPFVKRRTAITMVKLTTVVLFLWALAVAFAASTSASESVEPGKASRMAASEVR